MLIDGNRLRLLYASQWIAVFSGRADIVRGLWPNPMLLEVGIKFLPVFVKDWASYCGIAHEHGLALASPNNPNALANIRSQGICSPSLDGLFPSKYLVGEFLLGVVEIDADGGL